MIATLKRQSLTVAVVLVTAIASPAHAQASVQVNGPASNPILDGIGTFNIATSGFTAEDLPLRLELQIARTSDFSGVLFADTTVDGPNAVIVVPHLLPGSGVLFWRVFALTARAGSIPSPVVGPRTAPTNLSLISPNNPSGQSLTTTRPTFVWHASTIPPAVGAWEFEIRVEETATGRAVFDGTTNDTTITAAADLETNDSFRWRVIARLRATGDSLQVASFATFVLLSDSAPLTTLLLAPFPSPFPSATASRLCVWFDLQTTGSVTLDVTDLRGHQVKRMVPSATVSGTLSAGRYGRPSSGATSGCDDRFSWDGTDATGRVVPVGIYLVHLRAAGTDRISRVYFKGR